LTGRPFHEALTDINLVSQKDADIRMIEEILLASRFLPENPQIFQLELLSRFSRAPGANSPVIGRMVAEAAAMVLVTSERCIVPFYPCVSPSSAGVRRHTRYGPTHVLGITSVKLQQKEQQRQQADEENEEEEEEEREEEEYKEEEEKENEVHKEEEEEEEAAEEDDDEGEEKEKERSDDSATLAVIWGERCGLQVWRTGLDHYTLQPFYHISDEVCCLNLRKSKKHVFRCALKN